MAGKSSNSSQVIINLIFFQEVGYTFKTLVIKLTDNKYKHQLIIFQNYNYYFTEDIEITKITIPIQKSLILFKINDSAKL